MIEQKIIEETVNSVLQGTDGYLVDITISKDNDIEVEIDSDSGVDIDTCVAINNAIENALNRDVEDFSLQVGSSGLTSPFKVKRQYDRNVGNEVEVLSGSKKYVGILKGADNESFTIETEVKVKGEKKPQKQSLTFKYTEVKYTKYNLKFK